MSAHAKHRTEFATRLVALRQSRGMTQMALAEATDVTQRVISYYETAAENPNADMLMAFAKALRVSADELLGLRPVRSIDEAPSMNPTQKRYWKRFLQLRDLPEKDQKAVLRMLDSLAKVNVSA